MSAPSNKPAVCPRCSARLTPQEVGHVCCRKCAEADMASMLGAGILGLPEGWFRRERYRCSLGLGRTVAMTCLRCNGHRWIDTDESPFGSEARCPDCAPATPPTCAWCEDDPAQRGPDNFCACTTEDDGEQGDLFEEKP